MAGLPSRLAVTRLMLTDFRSYRSLKVEVGPQPVVLSGVNGAGKTNLLEALSLLAPGNGLRSARLADLVRRGDDGETRWAVAASVEAAQGRVEIGTGRDPERDTDRRLIRIDGETVRGQAALAEHLNLIWLTPNMDRLFLDGAPARRRFFDRLVYGVDSGHARRLGAFQRCMSARARVLRDGPADPVWLNAIEETMAEHAVAVGAARRDAVQRLQAALGAGAAPFPAVALTIRGHVEDWLDGMPAVDVEARLRESLAAARAQDAEAGGATIGPHRSDLEVHHLDKDLPAGQCSTGEQKMLLVAIVLADARLHAARGGRVPVLLLDEIAAHLDSAHVAALIEAICDLGAQAWLTGTDSSLFARFESRAQFFTVDGNALAPGRRSPFFGADRP
ncbi:MAG: DNA replication/repair protein RecF [Alphaproteobacteria bacterium]|nr:DNA replication/repair protein RecF [Alphaproteobacteria bacterium]